MPSAAAIHTAYFAVGAVVGGGLATVVSARRRRPELPPSGPSLSATTTVVPGVPPIIDVGPSGDARLPSGVVASALVSPVLKYGHPGPVPDLLVRKAYTAAYDRRLRHPAWTAEHLTLASLGKSSLVSPPSNGEGGDRMRSTFTEDTSLPDLFRARLQDFFKSGYDRGHMVPAADAKTSQDAMDETFLLSNIAPQVGDGFNRHYWAYVEDWCRRLTGTFSDVYVFTIPLYLPHKAPDGKWRINYEVIGSPPNVSVPTHFAKVVLASRPSSPKTLDVHEISTGAFVLPNAIIPDEAPLESFVTPVEAVERAAGLTLFSDAVKKASKHICQTTKCQVIVRRFDEERKRPELRRTTSAPK